MGMVVDRIERSMLDTARRLTSGHLVLFNMVVDTRRLGDTEVAQLILV